MKNAELNSRVVGEISNLAEIADLDGMKRLLDTIELIKDLCLEINRLESDI